jgi:hypothetical protein
MIIKQKPADQQTPMMQQSKTFDNKVVFILKNKHYAKSYTTFKM